MSQQHIQARRLTCIRGDRQLFTDLDVLLHSGQLLYLRGRNGSGKTTLLRTLCGLFHPDAGDVLWCGEKIADLGELFYRYVLFIGHAPGVKLELTPLENLRIYNRLRASGVSEAALWQALRDVELHNIAALPAHLLSAGQRRRIMLARLLIDASPLWLLDEPFVALDDVACDFLQTAIIAHIRRGGLVALTTHQQIQLPDVHIQHLFLGD